MPKIIADIEEKILTAAGALFSAQGYQDGDMRQIAELAGIAVGTIYQYFSDKQELYLRVLSSGWMSIIRRLEEISEGDQPPQEQLREMLAVLSEEISSRQIWEELSVLFSETGTKNSDNIHFVGMHNKFSLVFGRVIKQMLPADQQSELMANQLGSFAFVMAADLSHLPSEDAVKQSQLIADLLINHLEKTFPPKDTS
jgi:AcrR family transcriptional regulator